MVRSFWEDDLGVLWDYRFKVGVGFKFLLGGEGFRNSIRGGIV